MKGEIKPILIHPNPILRQVSEPLALNLLNTPEFKQFLADMDATMKEKDGAGLAAPQIEVSQRVFVIGNRNGKSTFLINPSITRKSWGKVIGEEGCLSVVDSRGKIIYGQVERHKNITVQYYDPQGKKKKIQADEHLARVLQHEIDHLNGILFIDHLIN
ncbi:MAG: peptide deformylase [bacterium]|nr:peptide deformylase [bacterium]